MGLRNFGFLLFQVQAPILRDLFLFLCTFPLNSNKIAIIVIITAFANITALGLCYKYYGKRLQEIYERRASMPISKLSSDV
jgi:hypothetical protein